MSEASGLARLQAAVQRFLLDPGQPVEHLIAANARLPPATQVGVYAEAYRARLVEALDADFSGLHAYLGDDEFRRLVHAYLAEHPSRNFSLRWFGAELAAFLAVHPVYAPHRELAELACFEWAQCHAFDAPDVIAIDGARLAAIASDRWPGLRLQFHPSLTRLDLHTNAPALWLALNEDEVPPALEQQEQSRPWLVWRHDLKILFRSLTEAEAFGLDRFRAGARFSAVCEQWCDWFAPEDVPAQAAGYLQHWINAGWVVDAC
ncbi:MAG: DNA-binding domain-containing protein [Porticoccaceae bacterium]